MFLCAIFAVPFAGVLKELKVQNIKNKFEAEKQAAHQNYEVETDFTIVQLVFYKSSFEKIMTEFVEMNIWLLLFAE